MSIKQLKVDLQTAIQQAEHKPGDWSQTAQSMGGICCPGEPFQIGKPWPKEAPWAQFSYKRDSWLAVAAVNALPDLLAEIERLEAELRGSSPDYSDVERLCKVLGYLGVSTPESGEEAACKWLRLFRVLLRTAETSKLLRQDAPTVAEHHKLKAESETLRKDAERYRWLRDKQTFIWLIQDWFPGEAVLTNVDSEIDTAMAKEASNE